MFGRIVVMAVFLLLSCAPRQASKGPSGINYAGGSGESFHEAIVISGAKSKGEGIAAEYKYISGKHGSRGDGWLLVGQTLIREKNKIVDVLEIQLGNSPDRRIYYFEVSDFLGKRR